MNLKFITMQYTITFQFNKTNTKIISNHIKNKTNSYTFKTKNELIEFMSEIFYYNVNTK